MKNADVISSTGNSALLEAEREVGIVVPLELVELLGCVPPDVG